MSYGFINQTLDKFKTNIVVALKEMIMPNSHWHILEKCIALLTEVIIGKIESDVSARKV